MRKKVAIISFGSTIVIVIIVAVISMFVVGGNDGEITQEEFVEKTEIPMKENAETGEVTVDFDEMEDKNNDGEKNVLDMILYIQEEG